MLSDPEKLGFFIWPSPTFM